MVTSFFPPRGAGVSSLVDIRQFGAVGNGAHDNSPAFQLALDYARSNGGCVFVPDGIYAISSPIILQSDDKLCGLNKKGGERSCVKPLPGWDTTRALIESKDLSTQRQRRISVTGLYLDCASTALYGIRFFTQDSKIEDVTIKYGWTYGIWIQGIGNTTTDELALNNFVHDCFIQGSATTKWWVAFFVDYFVGDTNLWNSYLEGANNALVKTRGANDIFIGNHLYLADYGFFFETNNDRICSNNYIENIDKEAVRVESGSGGNAVLNGVFSHNVLRNINKGGTAAGAITFNGSNLYSASVIGNVLRKDSSLPDGSVPYFVYFEPPFDTNDGTRHVSGNVAQSGLVTVSQTNLT